MLRISVLQPILSLLRPMLATFWTYSGRVLGEWPEMLNMSLLRPILARSWVWRQKSLKWASRGLFWPGSGHEARNTQNEPPEHYFGQDLGLAAEMLKMSLLRPILARFFSLRPDMLKISLVSPILARFWASRQKCLKWASWGLFWPRSGPEARNTQHEPLEAYSDHVLGLVPGTIS